MLRAARQAVCVSTPCARAIAYGQAAQLEDVERKAVKPGGRLDVHVYGAVRWLRPWLAPWLAILQCRSGYTILPGTLPSQGRSRLSAWTWGAQGIKLLSQKPIEQRQADYGPSSGLRRTWARRRSPWAKVWTCLGAAYHVFTTTFSKSLSLWVCHRDPAIVHAWCGGRRWGCARRSRQGRRWGRRPWSRWLAGFQGRCPRGRRGSCRPACVV